MTVLRQADRPNLQITQDLELVDDMIEVLPRESVRFAEDAVDTETDENFVRQGIDVDIGRAALGRFLDNKVHLAVPRHIIDDDPLVDAHTL